MIEPFDLAEKRKRSVGRIYFSFFSLKKNKDDLINKDRNQLLEYIKKTSQSRMTAINLMLAGNEPNEFIMNVLTSLNLMLEALIDRLESNRYRRTENVTRNRKYTM